MASSLDRLKKLTTKLDEKLIEKGIYSKEYKVEDSIVVHDLQKDVDKSESFDLQTILLEEPKKIVEEPIVVSKPFKSIRRDNIERIEALYLELNIVEKSPDFKNIFIYKAMNLSGIGLKEEDFAEVRAGKYIQVIAITYEPDANGKKKAKNISLGYFGKGDTIDLVLKEKIIEFVLRWRYEKAFQNVQHYKELIAKLDKPLK